MWTSNCYCGYPHSSKYHLTDVNVCGAVQYIDTAAADLQVIECLLYQDKDILFIYKIFYLFIYSKEEAKN